MTIQSAGAALARVARPVLLVIPLLGCSDDVTNVYLPDCGLVRNDLVGNTWTVVFSPADSFLTNCDIDPLANDGTPISVDSTPIVFVNDMTVYASPGNVGFQFQSTSSTFYGDVEADSCLMIFTIEDSDDGQDLHCLGTFDVSSQSMLGGCDSSTIFDDPNALGLTVPDYCDIDQLSGDGIIGVTLTITIP